MPRKFTFLLAFLLALVLVPSAAWANSSETTTQTITYRGVSVDVPADWPIVDLVTAEAPCINLAVNAVYLGPAPVEPQCSSRAIGRDNSVWLSPATEADATGDDRLAGKRTLVLAGVAIRTANVDDEASWPISDAIIASARKIDGTASPTPTPTPTESPSPSTDDSDPSPTDGATTVGPSSDPDAPPEPTPSEPSPAGTSAPSVIPAALSAPARGSGVSAGRSFTGMAFDACDAPSVAAMKAWRSSPYSAIGVYIAGDLRACDQKNLTRSWVSSVSSQGWGLLPIYVGKQAPCTTGRYSKMPSTSSGAAREGRAGAAQSAAAARNLGLPKGSVIYADIEYYKPNDASCTNAVLSFVSAFTSSLHAYGYQAGVYGNPTPMMSDMSRAVASRRAGFVPPDDVWFARWDGIQTVHDQAKAPGFPNRYWSKRQRVKQYSGERRETWGSVTINIDANWVYAKIPGNPRFTSYGYSTRGPGSSGFWFTGNMNYWRPMPGQGTRGRAYWTGTNQSTKEANGATWSPKLGVGVYKVRAYIPASNNTGIAHYTVTHGGGTSRVTMNQASGSGWRTLGTFATTSAGSLRVHLGDNDTRAGRIVADAMTYEPANRLAAATYRETSVAISKALYPSGRQRNGRQISEVFVASRTKYGGAVAVGPLAARTGPVLLVPATGRVPASIVKEIRRLRPRMVTLIGGKGEISLSVSKQLPRGTSGKRRIDEGGRYATAAKIALKANYRTRAATGHNARTVFVVSGTSYTQGLAASAAAGQVRGAVLLSKKSGMPASTRSALRKIKPTRIYVVGGTWSLSNRVISQARSTVPKAKVSRLSDGNRYGTAAKISSVVYSRSSTAIIATGTNYRDAAAAAPYAVARNSPVLLTPRNCLTSSTRRELSRLRAGPLVGIGSKYSVSGRALARAGC